MAYRVVFEYTPKAGGYAGNRYSINYQDKARFASLNREPNDREIVIAEGVTDDEAQNLTSLTPEICSITAAIQECCYLPNGQVDSQQLQVDLPTHLYSIQNDREYISSHHLSRLTDFVKCTVGPEDTEKNRLLRLVLGRCNKYNGMIDISVIQRGIAVEILDILSDRMVQEATKRRKEDSRLIPLDE
jgi:hypothetical protein